MIDPNLERQDAYLDEIDAQTLEFNEGAIRDYLADVPEIILERIAQFEGKLYMEFGGKMLEDFHAARVLPGYEPDNKIKLLQELKDQVEIVIAINASNIEHSKARGDLGISYDQEVVHSLLSLLK